MTDYLIRNGRAVLKICYAAVCALSFFVAAHAYAQPSTVFVWNKPLPNMPDGADFVNEGFIWQELGLLDRRGKPGHVAENGQDIVDEGGNKLGEVIKKGENIVGYKNLDGTKEAYDINNGYTMSEAWERVAPNGELHIIKHGLFLDVNGNSVVDPGEEGGGLRLDNGAGYTGFRAADTPGPGTGTPFGQPDGTPMAAYPLTPRRDANIRLRINSCYSSDDRDGAGPEKSVARSAEDVPGVRVPAEGVNGQALGGVAYDYEGPGEGKDFDAAEDALGDAAVAANEPDVADWISNLPFADQYAMAQHTIDAAIGPGKVTILLTYSKEDGGVPRCEPGGRSCVLYHSHPVQCPVTGGRVQYSNNYSLAILELPPGALQYPRMLHARQIVDFSAMPLLSGAVLRSGMYDFRFPDYPTELATPGRITLRYLPNQTLDLYLPMDIYRFDTTTRSWKIDGDTFDKVIDPQTSLISTIAPEIGIYAAFSKLPKLDAEVMNSNIVISWQCPAGSTGFVLQSSTSPVGPWVTDSGFTLTTFDVDGDGILDCIASTQINSGAKFYRLYLPVQ